VSQTIIAAREDARPTKIQNSHQNTKLYRY
jgi:hypothetical protein